MEIGSEYSRGSFPAQAHTVELPQALQLGDDICLTWLGRTAIDLVLSDILQQRSAQSVYMPSYCCDSMIAPFLERGIAVNHYPVNYYDSLCAEPDPNIDCDIFFSMNYFGGPDPAQEAVLAAFRAKGAIVVEDITHSLFSGNPCHRSVDYAVASLRKWIETPAGGIAIKFKGSFLVQANATPPEYALKTRIEAMREKHGYLQGELVDKASYLEKFTQFNNSLERNYQGTIMDPFTKGILGAYDFSLMIKKRRENAAFLQQALQGSQSVRFMVPSRSGDCPLFVPILVDDSDRDELHRVLVQNQIYCPKHWPMPNNVASNIYSREISLICDQRYDLLDMDRIIACIQNFYD